jgi:hypothetical protein
MQVHGRSKEATEYLESVLVQVPDVPFENVNNAIHVWLPGVKSLVPPDYCFDMDAAWLTAPIGDDTQPYNFNISYDKVSGYQARVYGEMCEGQASAINPCLAFILASVRCYLSYFQAEESKKVKQEQ